MAISIVRAIEGLNLHMAAEGRSPHTVRDYNTTFRRFVEFIGPMSRIDAISTDDVRRFLAFWQDALVTPDGIARRPPRKLSKKSILNMHTGLSALWSWALREHFVEEHVLSGRLKPPAAQRPPVEPLNEKEVKDLLAACEQPRRWTTNSGYTASASRPTADRDRAMVLFALDTGCRASEICGLDMQSLDLKAGSALVLGKGDKKRMVAFGPKTGRALFRYLAHRDATEPADPVFLNRSGDRMTRSGLLALIRRAGRRAGISRCYPHRLRHTFAINYLRYGGDIYTLQKQLGHSSLDMVRRYLKIAGADVLRVHRRASPVENML